MVARGQGRPNPVWTLVIGLVAVIALVAGAALLLRTPESAAGADPRPPAVSEQVVAADPSDHETSHQPAPALAPRTLSLGGIGVLAPVGVSTVPGGVLTPPDNVSTVGIWLDGAPLDATEGTTLLAGHVNMADQGRGALFDLALMQPGDVIHTSDDTGITTAWRVSRVEERPKTDGIEESVFACPDGPRRLAVVTCGGDLTFDGVVGDYQNNIYLYTDPVS